MSLNYYCSTELHGGVQTPASYYVKAAKRIGSGRFDDREGLAYSCCADHLHLAITTIGADHDHFVVRKVNNE